MESAGPVIDAATGLPLYGLDAELYLKREAKRDSGLEGEVQSWIESVTGERFAGPTFGESLKDGVLLCKLINVIRPGSVRRINESRMPFKQMENVTNFIKACRALGVPEPDLFTTVALYELKNIGQVTTCLHALGMHTRALPGYSGPSLGPKMAEAKPRTFTDRQLRESRAMPTRISEGSSKTMERSEIDRSREIVKPSPRAVADATPTLLSLGSSRTMERSEVHRPMDPTFGADAVGPGREGIPAATAGSPMMERTEVHYRDIVRGPRD
eukprot:PLAT13953.1.p2 GENE.PLAT13953.1~~PLAT13953.1.p2  ORF type:complete len:282 (+),score=89.73 PLAT13953.1:37-846(+)